MRFLLMILLFVVSTLAQPYGEIFQSASPHLVEIKNRKRAFYKLQQTQTATPNQQQFDVSYYKLNLEIDPLRKMITGYVQVKAQVVDGALNYIELNLHDNMVVDSVVHASNPLSFSHQNHLLNIQLGKDYTVGDTLSLRVYYHGNPSQTGSDAFVFTSYNGKPHFWSLSEPYGAREWWPCKDVPEDKADSADIVITVPQSMIVASNGLLKKQETKDLKTTFYWHESYPIVSYLISVTGYEYYRYSDTYLTLDGDTMPIEFFMYPDHYENDAFRYNYSLTKEMLTAFAGYFGEYPFVKEKYGHAEFLWGGGMEHQTCSSLGGFGSGLIAHELAHQWWGDMITCRNFHHIWLNEGFATYSEALWREYDEGMEGYFDEISGDAYKGPGTIYVEDDTNEDEIFDGNLSYSKAAYVLHMLRHVVGDSVFFDILQAYYADTRYQYATAVTEDFQEVCEQVSGLKLDKFFQQWIYGEYYPQYEYSWNSVNEGQAYRIDLTIKQTQTNTGLFWMPIDVFVHMAGADTVIVVWDSLQTQQFVLKVPQEPLQLGLDEDNWILCDKNEVPSALAQNDPQVLRSFQILKVYPNPFNPQVTLEFSLEIPASVSLSVFNAKGQKVADLLRQKRLAAGNHSVNWTANQYASGLYYFKLTANGRYRVEKALLIK